MAGAITSGYNAAGNSDQHGVGGIDMPLNLDATLANIAEATGLTEEEHRLLAEYANGYLAELPENLREKLGRLRQTLGKDGVMELMRHGVDAVNVTATALIEDKDGGDGRLAEMIATHPQAEFIWGENALQRLTAMSLRQQLAIVTKYWGGSRKTANRLAALGPENGGLSQADSKTFQYSWDNFNRSNQDSYIDLKRDRVFAAKKRPPPNVDLILRAWDGRPPKWYDLDYPLPALSQLILRQPQLTDQERSDIRALPARALHPLFIDIFGDATNRITRSSGEKIRPKIWPGIFGASDQTLSCENLETITERFTSVHYRLDGKRPLPELARAMAGYFTRSHITLPDQLGETASLQSLAEILFETDLGGKALTNQMRAAGIAVRPGDSFWHSIDRARRGKAPYWSDDWSMVTDYLADENNSRQKPKQKLTGKEELLAAIAAYQAMQSAAEISTKFGCSASTVIARLREAGVEIRSAKKSRKAPKPGHPDFIGLLRKRGRPPKHPVP